MKDRNQRLVGEVTQTDESWKTKFFFVKRSSLPVDSYLPPSWVAGVKLKVSKDKEAQGRINKIFDLDKEERNFGRFNLKSASSNKTSDDTMEDATAQSAPTKKSPPLDALDDQGFFDMSETPKAPSLRRSTLANTRASKKCKIEPGLIDLTEKKVPAKSLKVQAPLDFNTVKSQFQTALDMASYSSELVWRFMNEKMDESNTLKQQLTKKEKDLKVLERDLLKTKNEFAKVTKKLENQANETEKKLKEKSDLIIRNAKMSTQKSIAGVKVQMALEAQLAGLTLPEEWEPDKWDAEYVSLGGQSKLDKVEKEAHDEEELVDAAIDDTFNAMVKEVTHRVQAGNEVQAGDENAA